MVERNTYSKVKNYLSDALYITTISVGILLSYRLASSALEHLNETLPPMESRSVSVSVDGGSIDNLVIEKK